VVAIIHSQESCIHTQYTNVFLSQSCIISCIFLYIYTRICRLRNIGPPSRIHNTRLEKRLENEERLHPKAQYQRKLEGVWNDVAHLIGLLKQMFWDNFSFNEIMHFQKFILMFLHITFHFQIGSFKQTSTLYTENEWPNLRIHSSYRRGRCRWK